MTGKEFKEKINQYNDIVRGVKDLRERLKKLESNSTTVADSVKGSMKNPPYTEHTIVIRGAIDDPRIKRKKKMLKEKLHELEAIKDELEIYINTEIPNERIRQIMQYKFIDEFSWVKIAFRMGGKSTEESVRKELERFFKNI